MSRLLIVYATTDGQTAKIARFLGAKLEARGAKVDLFNVAVAAPNPDGYDGVLVAGSIHANGYQPPLVEWVRGHAPELRTRPAAFLSVCLAILQRDEKTRRELDLIKARFVTATGWDPPEFKFVAGGLYYTRYGWIKRMVMRHIVRRGGGDTDTSRDYEYTDWADLENFAIGFLGSISTAPSALASPAAR